MKEKKRLEKSLLEQILERTLESLRGHAEFDSPSLEALSEVARRDRLSRTQDVLKAIEATPTGNETT